MVSNNTKNKAEAKLQKQRRSDLIMNRLMIAFVIAVLGIFGMVTVKKTIANEAFFFTNMLIPLLVVSGLLLAGAIVLFALRVSRHVDDTNKIFTRWNVLGTAIVLFGACLFYKVTADASMVIAGLVAAVALYFVYHIFKTDFFVFSVVTALGILLLKMGSTNYYSAKMSLVVTACGIMAVVVAIAGLIIALLAIAGKGTITVGSKKLKLYAKGEGCAVPMIVASVITLVGGILEFAAVTFVIYAIIALIAAFIASIVIYAIKMM
ncbi:MAG: hypothetical protein HFE63_02085 [Clostridiales bacterium]|nr:hypothetical protein [Clostridiales bacterium]